MGTAWYCVLVGLYAALVYVKFCVLPCKLMDVVVYSPLLCVNAAVYYIILQAMFQLYTKNA